MNAGAASTIAAVSTTTQSAPAGSTVSAPPSVRVTDAGGNPVSGVSVTFAVASGGGSTVPASGSSVSTNASGLATLTSWTLGTTAGANSVTATAAGLTGSPVTFNATGTVGAPTQLVLVTPPSSTVTSGAAFAAQPVLELRDANSNVVTTSSLAVTAARASGSATLGGTLTVNAVNGVATFTNLSFGGLGTGAHTIEFTTTSPALSQTSSTITVNAGAASAISAVSTTTQSAPAGTAVTAPPSVRVTDAGGNPVSGVSVTFAVASGGGSTNPASGSSVSTNASGLATLTSWTLGTTAGANSVTATAAGLTGSPVTFNATGTVGTPTQLVITSQPSSTATSGAAFAAQPVLELRDANGNVVTTSTLAVTAARASGSATLGGTVTVNAVNGVATFTNLSFGGLGTGAHTLTFTTTSPALTITSGTITVNAGAASTIASASATTQTATAGSAVSAPPSVLVTDAGGNPVSGVSVTFDVASGGGSTSPTSGTSVSTNASGLAILTSWTLGTTAGANSVTATAAGLTGSPVTFNATGTAGAPTQLVVTTQPAGAASGVAFSTQPVVEIRDANGNRVTTSTLEITATIGTGTGTLGGTVAVSAAAGIATFTDLAITGSGDHTLSFSTVTPALTVPSGTVSVTALLFGALERPIDRAARRAGAY